MSKFIKNISILQYLGNHIPFKPKLNTCTKVTNSASKNTTPKTKKCNKKKKKEIVQPPMSKASMWRNIFLFGLLPALLGLSAFVLSSLDEHERQPFVPYEYLRLRRHRFPWGEGNKSLFHNPIVNALPEGYEDELERKEQEKQLKEAQKK